MSDIASNPRLLELIELAKNASQLHSEMSARREATGEVDEAITAIYADIGRLVYRLVTDTADVPPLERRPVPFTPSVSSEAATDRGTYLPMSDRDSAALTNDQVEGDSWYTEEVEIDTSEPLFSEEDKLEEYTDIPESDPDPVDTDAGEDGSIDEEFAVARLDEMFLHRAESGHPLNDLASLERDPTWTHKLTQLLGLLNLPSDFSGEDEMAVEASRVQWAASELGRRLDGLPQSIQVCVIGMLAARAQHLRTQLTVDVGPRLALDRIRRYRIESELPSVAGLTAQPVPETGTWVGDIQDWWRLIQPSNPENAD